METLPLALLTEGDGACRILRRRTLVDERWTKQIPTLAVKMH